MVNVLDLFSGIGGFSLGLERAGMRTVAFCEVDPYCRRVLAKHWPDVPCYGDVRELTGQKLWDDGNTVSIQVICGGFPCQDISLAGGGAGLAGERSGLWREFARIIGDLRPNFVIVENVAALLGRGIGDVLGDLAAIGYDAEWHCIPACAVGAPHIRDRVWIIAYSAEVGRTTLLIDEFGSKASPGRQFAGMGAQEIREWPAEAVVCRASDGLPYRLDAVASLGNAVVPQIAEIIGRSIMTACPQ